MLSALPVLLHDLARLLPRLLDNGLGGRAGPLGGLGGGGGLLVGSSLLLGQHCL